MGSTLAHLGRAKPSSPSTIPESNFCGWDSLLMLLMLLMLPAPVPTVLFSLLTRQCSRPGSHRYAARDGTEPRQAAGWSRTPCPQRAPPLDCPRIRQPPCKSEYGHRQSAAGIAARSGETPST